MRLAWCRSAIAPEGAMSLLVADPNGGTRILAKWVIITAKWAIVP